MEERYTAKGEKVELRLTFRLTVKADEDITDENLEELAVIAFAHVQSSYKLGFRGLDHTEAHLSCVEIDPDERRLHYLDRTKY
tara:strand:+ start:149 stop:397 length:249 start_codon:yes stop_codon:yes gene_type:complete